MMSNAIFLKREVRNFSKLYLMLECAKDEPKYYQQAKRLCRKILDKIDHREKLIAQVDLEMVLFEQNVRSFYVLINRIIAKREEYFNSGEK